MSRFLDSLRERILLCDGAMGSRVQSMDLDVTRDYDGQENCTEILNRTRPDIVRKIHVGYFEAGADMVETNTFGGARLTLGEFSLQDETFALNKRAGELAREALEQFKGDGRQRFVIGAIGRAPSCPAWALSPIRRPKTPLPSRRAGWSPAASMPCWSRPARIR